MSRKPLLTAILGVGALCLLGLPLLAQDATPALTGDPVKIGVAVAHTGNASIYGGDQLLGAQLAADYLNANGGVNGRPIEIVSEDTASDEPGAIKAFQALIDADVVAIIGPTLSQQAFAVDPIADKAGVPVIGPSVAAAGIPEIGPYISRVAASTTVIAPNSIKAALQLNSSIKNVDVLYAKNDAYSTSETKVFQKTLDDLGLTTVHILEFQTTDTAFDDQVKTVMADKPELVTVSGLAKDSSALINALRTAGYTGLIVGGNGMNSLGIMGACGTACDGVILSQGYSPDYDSAINKTFIDAYTAKQNSSPSQFPAQPFAATQVIVEALRALGDVSSLSLADLRTQLNTQILKGTYDTPMGILSFTPEGEALQQAYFVVQIKINADGKTGKFALLTQVAAEAEATPEATP